MFDDYDTFPIYPVPDDEPEPVKSYPAVPSTNGVVKTEPIMLGSIIGKEVRRCGICQRKIDKNDNYCRWCGARITGWVMDSPEVIDID